MDALNPIQVSAKGMDTKTLKREFGKDDICFWGGIDTQRVLPFGSVQDVQVQVRRRVEDLGPDGYCVCAVHNLQADAPREHLRDVRRRPGYGQA